MSLADTPDIEFYHDGFQVNVEATKAGDSKAQGKIEAGRDDEVISGETKLRDKVAEVGLMDTTHGAFEEGAAISVDSGSAPIHSGSWREVERKRNLMCAPLTRPAKTRALYHCIFDCVWRGGRMRPTGSDSDLARVFEIRNWRRMCASLSHDAVCALSCTF